MADALFTPTASTRSRRRRWRARRRTVGSRQGGDAGLERLRARQSSRAPSSRWARSSRRPWNTGGSTMPVRVVRAPLRGGSTSFSLGLILVVVAGAELFTGNNLIVMALGEPARLDRAPAAQLGDRDAGNFVGAIATAVLLYRRQAVRVRRRRGRRAGAPIAAAKTSLGFVQAIVLGRSATRSSASPSGSATARARPPTRSSRRPAIAAFVAAGFEHSVGRDDVLHRRLGLFVKASSTFDRPSQFPGMRPGVRQPDVPMALPRARTGWLSSDASR